MCAGSTNGVHHLFFLQYALRSLANNALYESAHPPPSLQLSLVAGRKARGMAWHSVAFSLLQCPIIWRKIVSHAVQSRQRSCCGHIAALILLNVGVKMRRWCPLSGPEVRKSARIEPTPPHTSGTGAKTRLPWIRSLESGAFDVDTPCYS